MWYFGYFPIDLPFQWNVYNNYMKRWFIGDTAKRCNLNPRTIRYYERIGILPSAGRSEGGYRVYGEATIERLGFILKAKSLGLTLDEIKEILLLHDEGKVPCECTRSLISSKITEIERRIADLAGLKTRLQAILGDELPKTSGSICPMITGAEKTS